MVKNFHRKWYAGETISVSIGQGAVEATPMQLARIIGGIASGGHMVRPHVVFPDQLSADYRKDHEENYPGSGDAYFPMDPENWMTVTDGMAAVTQPGLYHTAGAEGLPGIDFAGKTGTAEVVGHDTSGHAAKGHAFIPNVWFVGVTPRRNPELVVAVLWQNGEYSYYAARVAARVVAAYVEKKRRLENNLVPQSVPKPVEMGAVWTTPEIGADGKNGKAGQQPPPMQAGHFLVDHGEIVAAKKTGEGPAGQKKPVPDRVHDVVAKAKQQTAEQGNGRPSTNSSRKGQ